MSRITSDTEARPPERRHCAYRLADSPTGFCTFRPEIEHDGEGLCGWHHLVRSTPTPDTLEALEAWRTLLVRAQICDRWTHFTAQELWQGVRGGARDAWAQSCGAGDCPHPPRQADKWQASKPSDRCDVEGCTKTVREHIDECLAITSRPGTVFTRPSQRATTPADPDPAREARRQELLAQAREILKAGEI